MFRILAFCLALAASTHPAPVLARDLVDVSVVDRDRGDWLPEYSHRGQRWIAGTPGHRYAVRLSNASSERVLVVLSVDGINAVSGQTAHPAQAGYVLEPWQSSEIAGWRNSFEEVSQFVFTDLPDSYAFRTGRPDDVGVIGIAVFREARPITHAAPMPAIAQRDRRDGGPARNASTATAPVAAESAMRDQAAQGLGTGYGAREWSPVSRTGFLRASRQPAQLSQLRYDDEASLANRGVLPRQRWPRDDAPRAFPGGFVADPPPR